MREGQRTAVPRCIRRRAAQCPPAPNSHEPGRARTETAPDGRTRWASSCPRCPAGSRECRSAQWDVTWPQAERLKALVRPAVRVVRRPPGLVLEQANGANVAIGAQIEPMPGAARHANQVSRFDL